MVEVVMRVWVGRIECITLWHLWRVGWGEQEGKMEGDGLIWCGGIACC